eukprot:scaffold100013_cov22-Tisochrysis_lutea.AAC.2
MALPFNVCKPGDAAPSLWEKKVVQVSHKHKMVDDMSSIWTKLEWWEGMLQHAPLLGGLCLIEHAHQANRLRVYSTPRVALSILIKGIRGSMQSSQGNKRHNKHKMHAYLKGARSSTQSSQGSQGTQEALETL